MPGPTSVKCPHCDANLKLKDASKLGKQMTCPKCKTPFKAEAIDDDEAEFGALANSSRDYEEDELPPPRRSTPAARSGAAKKKPQRRSSNSSFVPILLGGVVLVVMLGSVGAAIYFFMGRENPAPVVADAVPAADAAPASPPAAPSRKNLDLSWLPPQSDMIVYLRPADLLKSAFAQWVIEAADGRKQVDEGQEKMKQEFGITFADVESITIGIKSNDKLTAEAAGLAAGGMPNPMQAMNGLSKLGEQEISGVIRLTKGVDLKNHAKFKEQMESVPYSSDGVYYRDKPKDGKASEQCVFIPSPTMIVMSGREDVMKALCERQGKAEPRAEMDFIDPGQHLSLTFVPKRDAGGTQPASDPAADDPLAQFKKLQAACFGIKAGDGLTFTLSQSCADSKVAEGILKATNDVVSQAKEKFESNREAVPKNIAQLADTLLKEIKVSQRDRLIETATSLPATTRDNLKAAPGELIAMFMGGMGGGVGTTSPASPAIPADVATLARIGVREVQTFSSSAMLGFAAISDDGVRVALGAEDKCVVYDVASGKEVATFDSPPPGLICRVVSLSKDGKLLAYGNGDANGVWDVDKKKVVRPFKDAKIGGVGNYAFGPDGLHFFIADHKGRVTIVELPGGKLKGAYEGVNPDGINLMLSVAAAATVPTVAASTDKEVRIWNEVGSRPKFVVPFPDPGLGLSYVAVSPDGTSAAAALNNKIILIDTETGEHREIGDLSKDLAVTGLRFPPGGKSLLVIAGRWEGAIRPNEKVDFAISLWDVKSGQRIAAGAIPVDNWYSMPYLARITPDARYVIAGVERKKAKVVEIELPK